MVLSQIIDVEEVSLASKYTRKLAIATGDEKATIQIFVEYCEERIDLFTNAILRRSSTEELINCLGEITKTLLRFHFIPFPNETIREAAEGAYNARILHWQSRAAADKRHALAMKPKQPQRGAVDKYKKHNGIKTDPEAARSLGVSIDVLKYVMSPKGKPRCSEENYESVLKNLSNPSRANPAP